MSQLLKREVQARAGEIKSLILAGSSFASSLTQLYLDLSVHGKYQWLVEIFYTLSLYVPEDKQTLLYHPALLKALLSVGKPEQARAVALYLKNQHPIHPETVKFLRSIRAKQQSSLPAYTAVASLSKYVRIKQKRTLKNSPLPVQWTTAWTAITPGKLEEIGYLIQRKKLQHAPRIYRKLLTELFDEFMLNYLLGQKRAVVVLSGALLEMILAIHLHENMHITRIHINNKRTHVFDLNLNELLSFYAQHKFLSPALLRLCQSTRMQRNFVHPGKEILEKTNLSPALVRVCFLSVLEVIDALL